MRARALAKKHSNAAAAARVAAEAEAARASQAVSEAPAVRILIRERPAKAATVAEAAHPALAAAGRAAASTVFISCNPVWSTPTINTLRAPREWVVLAVRRRPPAVRSVATARSAHLEAS